MSRSTFPAANECGMEPNGLSAVCLLGTRGGNGIRIRRFRLSSEFYFLSSFHRNLVHRVTTKLMRLKLSWC